MDRVAWSRVLGSWLVLGCSTAAPEAPLVESQSQALVSAKLEDTFSVPTSSGSWPSAAISGNTAVVGAAGEAVGTVNGQGAVYVRVRTPAGTWSQQQKLTAADGAANDHFGDHVAVEGNTLAVSNWKQAVYVFVRTGTTWALQQKLQPTITGYLKAALSGDTLVVISNDQIEAQVFARAGTTWTLQQKLGPHSYTHAAVSGNTIAFAYWTPNGIVELYERNGTTWSSAGSFDYGWGVGVGSMSLDGDALAVQLPSETRVYAKGTPWALVKTYSESGGGVAVTGATLLIQDSTFKTSLFTRQAGAWGSTPAYSWSPPNSAKLRAVSGPTAAIVDTYDLHLYRLAGVTGGPCGTAGECIESTQTCVDSVCCTSACTGACEACSIAAGGAKDGTCSPVAKGTPCGAFVCDGASGACPTSCGGDGDCAPGKFCSAAGACLDHKLQGASCVPATDCKNPATCTLCKPGLTCVEGFCCNGPCTGACDTCSQANGATANGTCTVLGKGATPVPAGGCNGLLCGGGASTCPTTCGGATDCLPGNQCQGGACIGPKALGATCTAGTECASGHCADGLCCDSVCTGQCEACDSSGAVGNCKPIFGTPHNKPDCNGSGLCKGQCNGANPTACTYPSLGSPCALATCTGDVLQPEGKCDGAGACSVPNTANCAPYTCDTATTSCHKTCGSDAQCAQGAVCDTTTGKCAGASATCADATTVKLPSGQTQSCEPYKCVGGACQQQCAKDGDCADGYLCDAPLCVAQSDAGSGGSAGTGGGAGTAGSSAGTGGKTGASGGDDGGCGCRTPRRGAGGSAALVALWALGGLIRRRRARSVSGRAGSGSGRSRLTRAAPRG